MGPPFGTTLDAYGEKGQLSCAILGKEVIPDRPGPVEDELRGWLCTVRFSLWASAIQPYRSNKQLLQGGKHRLGL